jgi:hypothetical protein
MVFGDIKIIRNTQRITPPKISETGDDKNVPTAGEGA